MGKTFLSRIPQALDAESLIAFDPSLDSAIRDVAQSGGMPASLGASAILEAQAAIRTAQMLHDPEDRDAFTKGVIAGLLMAAALPELCQSFVNPKKEGIPQ